MLRAAQGKAPSVAVQPLHEQGAASVEGVAPRGDTAGGIQGGGGDVGDGGARSALALL